MTWCLKWQHTERMFTILMNIIVTKIPKLYITDPLLGQSIGYGLILMLQAFPYHDVIIRHNTHQSISPPRGSCCKCFFPGYRSFQCDPETMKTDLNTSLVWYMIMNQLSKRAGGSPVFGVSSLRPGQKSLSWKISKFRGTRKIWSSLVILNNDLLHGTVHRPIKFQDDSWNP